MQTRLSQASAQWGLTDPVLIAETPRATVFRVQCQGHLAALKLLTPEGIASEGGAPALLRHWNGNGSVPLLAASDDAHLLGWLPGPSLGDLARGGDDMGAGKVLAEAALRLHHASPLPGVETLDQLMAPLLSHPNPTPEMARAAGLARQLLATAPPPKLLHGDLHHDNLLGDGQGGWAAIDPKGVVGDPAFDLANAFRNPVGMEREAANPARAARLADLFADVTGYDRNRLLGWAGVLPALSAIWNGTETTPGHDRNLLASFLPLAEAALNA